MIAIILYKKIINKASLRIIVSDNQFYFIAWFFSILLNLYIGVYCNRQLFGAEIMAMIIILRITKKHGFSNIWLILFGIMITYTYSRNWIMTLNNSYQQNTITEEYTKSSDGVIYVDLKNIGGFNNPSTLYEKTIGYGEINSGRYMVFNRLLHEDKANKGKPDVKIYPAYLKGKENVDLGNQAIDYGKGSFLVIISKNSPAKFKVHRAYTLFGLTYPYDTVDATSLGKVIMSSPLWDAYWISDGMIGVIPTAVTQE
jgi:hypothetical protein